MCISRRPLVVSALLGALLAQPIGIASASNWAVVVDARGGTSQSGSAPSVPPGVTATCTSFLQTTVDVTWSAVPGATSYAVYASTTGATSGFALAATDVVGTVWTSPALTGGTYWFEAVAYDGTNWAGDPSVASGPRTVALLFCT